MCVTGRRVTYPETRPLKALYRVTGPETHSSPPRVGPFLWEFGWGNGASDKRDLRDFPDNNDQRSIRNRCEFGSTDGINPGFEKLPEVLGTNSRDIWQGVCRSLPSLFGLVGGRQRRKVYRHKLRRTPEEQ